MAKTKAKTGSTEKLKVTEAAPVPAPPRVIDPSQMTGTQTILFGFPERQFDTSKLTAFHKAQYEKLLHLRDSMLDTMTGVAADSLRTHAESGEASAFGMHQADAGSDAYDRDFALSLLSQEQDAFYEIQEAIKRIEAGTYGVCEMSNKTILKARLEAIPWARFTVECQAQVEKEGKAYRNSRQPVTSLFGLTDDDGRDRDEEEPSSDFKE